MFKVRQASVDALGALRDGPEPVIAAPPPAPITRMMSVCLGEEIP